MEIYRRQWVSITVLNSVTFKGNREQITDSSTCTCQELAIHPATRQMNIVLPERVENEKRKIKRLWAEKMSLDTLLIYN